MLGASRLISKMDDVRGWGMVFGNGDSGYHLMAVFCGFAGLGGAECELSPGDCAAVAAAVCKLPQRGECEGRIPARYVCIYAAGGGFRGGAGGAGQGAG